MVGLAISVAAFLFLCWVAIWGLSLLWAIFEYMLENKTLLILFFLLVGLLLLRWLV